ncbi:hypothetical protein F503_08158 [Ophiostoma piceae UAMH 11346]|uniref:Uncharacterized protein n=1 Tax=Ophiostoma piceae (strain UAMH 11346) TaxID=1262450 RepID=S3BYK6_OPHP1|nr:hypothetical protein F503_08158 [Ophiostoma piceae UAMH 11346]
MHDNRSHPLLEQVPLTVSPFVQLPRATTLPYRYKAMPSTLAPSVIEGGRQHPDSSASGSAKPKTPFVVSPANSLAAHPDDILASCHNLLAHLDRMQADAEAEMQALDARIKERELAEKRRVAPGWLDSEARLLIPERKDTPGSSSSSTPDAAAGASVGTAAADGQSTFQLSEMAAALPESAGAGAGASEDASGVDTIGGFSAEALNQAFGSSSMQTK